jgi:hypothetical protein
MLRKNFLAQPQIRLAIVVELDSKEKSPAFAGLFLCFFVANPGAADSMKQPRNQRASGVAPKARAAKRGV